MFKFDSMCCRVARHRRQVIEPEFIAEGTDSEDERVRRHDDDESSEEEELDDEEIEKRRTLLRQRALQRKQEEVNFLTGLTLEINILIVVQQVYIVLGIDYSDKQQSTCWSEKQL